MKKLLYTLTLLVILSSCRNLEKMVERGDYDNAIIFATRKLSAQKNKKTKHVQGLEEAFARINQRDLDEMAYLDGNKNPQNWSAIERIALKISNRQSYITPLMPLISKEGYEAYFDLVDTYAIMESARNGAAEFYYNEGSDLLTRATTYNDKKYARQAYYTFQKVLDRKQDYKEVHKLIRAAEKAGIAHIKVEVKNNSLSFVPAEINARLEALNIYKLNGTWKRFYIHNEPGMSYDHVAVLELNEISTSPERETISYYTDEKKVKDGYIYLKDKKGNFKRDSTGKKLKTEKFKTVYADITKVHREKSAFVSGYMKIYDNDNLAVLDSEALSVEAIFTDYALSYIGDKRAVSDKHRAKLKSHPAPFPHDLAIIGDATEKLKNRFMDAVSSSNI